jgi:uncharacterized protein
VSPAIPAVSGWSFFIAGFFGIWMCAAGILSSAGMKFPLGQPLIK